MQSMEDIWTYILDFLKKSLPPTVVDTWFDDAKILELTENTLVLLAPLTFKRDVILQRYIPLITDGLFALFGSPYTVEILDETDANTYYSKKSVFSQSPGDHSEYIFESFVVGPSNHYAYAAAQAVAEDPGKSHNPLFIYGGSGLGKTHLLHAIMNFIRKNEQNTVIRNFSAEQFTNELVAAIRSKHTEEFREKFRTADLLLVDDIQFISKSDFSQEEFFHTFDALHNAGRQIVLTSDRPPRDLTILAERLRSRFESGLIIDISPPDFETRIAIIKFKASRLGIVIPNDVAEYMAENITANIRQLEGSVKKLKALRDVDGLGKISIETAERAISDLIRESPGLIPTPELIISEVCSYYNIEERDLLGKGKKQNIAIARQNAMYLVKRLTNLNVTEIADRVFKRDRTTVSYALQKIEELRSSNSLLNMELDKIEDNIRQR